MRDLSHPSNSRNEGHALFHRVPLDAEMERASSATAFPILQDTHQLLCLHDQLSLSLFPPPPPPRFREKIETSFPCPFFTSPVLSVRLSTSRCRSDGVKQR